VIVLRARGWLHRDLAEQGQPGFVGALIGDLVICGATAFLLAFVTAAPIPDRYFAVIRLWSQVLFGETPLFLAFLAVLHWRAGLPARGAVFATSALALLGTYVFAYHVEPYRLQVERHELRVAGSSPGDTAWSVRILHVSDIQADRVGDYERGVIRRAAELAPDLVVLTGDYVQERMLPTGRQTARELSELLRAEGPRPPLGIFAVKGDTDDFGIEPLFERAGVRWLSDETVTLALPGGHALALIGLDRGTSWGAHPDRLRRLIGQAPTTATRIVFGHSPDYLLRLPDDQRVDLALAGHTHGGQVAIPLFGPPLTLSRVPRRIAAGGLGEHRGVPVHVSRGVGLERGSAPQIRFLCPPEISVLTLRN
jgi:predicted MPP superfamily phosphohydrolase